MDIQVRITKIGEVQNITENFRKRIIEVEEDLNSKYPQEREFELINDNVNLFDGFHSNQVVKVYYNRKGRRVKDKNGNERIINSDQIWKVEK